MDSRGFDDLTRGLAARPTRRGLLAGLAAGVLGAFGLRGAPEAGAQATAASCGNVICRSNPGKCKNGCVCCVASNGNSRCAPPGQCSWGQQVCPPERPYVDGVRGCVQCLQAGQCPAPGDPCAVAVCTAGACGTVAAAAGTPCREVAGVCDVAETCDGRSQVCPADRFEAGTPCRSASCVDGVATATAACSGSAAGCPPPVTRSCAPYRCAGATCATSCANDGECAAGFHCDGAVCLADTGLGQSCDEASDCTSGFCADGVCCDTACAGGCETCTGATPGTCSAVTCPEMPGNVCRSTTGVCDAQTGTCVYARAAEGAPCTSSANAACTSGSCSASGTCVQGPYLCNSECQTCNSAANTCDNVESFPPPSMRVECGGGKGYCIDGVCDFPCGEDCIDHCYDRYDVSRNWLGSFCCKDHLDPNGACCWVNDEFGVVDQNGNCQAANPRCCSDDCCPTPQTCFCSFGQISRCC